MIDPNKWSTLKRRIGQLIRHADHKTLLQMMRTFGLGASSFRRQWMREHGVPWNAGIEDYLKQRIGRKLGILTGARNR